MRIPGVSAFSKGPPRLSHHHLTQISPVNGGVIGAKCKRA